MLLKYVVRPDPTCVVTDDGYLYEWPQGGEAVYVLEHHRRSFLAVKGARLVELEVVDEPILFPAFEPVEPLNLATVDPPPPEPVVDLTGVPVEPPKVPARVPPEAWLATVPPPPLLPEPAVTPRVGHYWSAADLARLETTGGRRVLNGPGSPRRAR